MDTGSVMAALGACRAARDTKLVPSIVHVAQSHGLAPSLVVYNAVLGVYAAAQQVWLQNDLIRADSAGCAVVILSSTS
jgi:hypothetical protein